MNEVQFQHFHSAHCESGVTSSLLCNSGYSISEPLAFGIGSGLFFVHIPFFKVMGLPLTSFRTFPGAIFKKTCSRLGIPYEYVQYSNQIKGVKELDRIVGTNRPVGLRANIYWLPYIPEGFRFQFNAHNLIVYNKTSDGIYNVSDPVLEEPAQCSSLSLLRARFSKGPLAPKGLLFYPSEKSVALTAAQVRQAIKMGLKETAYSMLYTPLPFAGVGGINFLSKRIAKLQKDKKNKDQLKLNLGQIVRMQEEIGTGGAGFRFLYASFLQEASEKFNSKELNDLAQEMSESGNKWREFATLSVQYCKDRYSGDFQKVPMLLKDIYRSEKSIFSRLKRSSLSV